LTNLRVRARPDFNFFLATLVVGDDSSLILRLCFFRFFFVAVQDRLLFWRGLDVID
jgi:hypothetical protein